MASKSSNSLAFFISINLLFFSLVSESKTPPNFTPSRASNSCPIDTLKLGVCGDFLNKLIGIIIEYPPNTSCCKLINGLVDYEAADCLCNAIKGNVLGVNLDVPASLNLLLHACGKKTPSGFKCV